ncbi:MAG: hypothetical protein GW936_08715 [Gallionella sp.]|nr:hypothetical protein [Gallionella sp.]
MKFMKIVGMLSVCALLAACGEKNPLEGKWNAESRMGMSGGIEFKSGSMIVKSEIMGISNEAEVKVDDYKIEKDKVGVVISKDNVSQTIWYALVDENTIQEGNGFASVRYQRAKQ